MPQRSNLTKRKGKNMRTFQPRRRKLTNKKNRKSQKGGGENKISHKIQDIFSSNIVEYLPLTSIFINNLQNKYVHMVDLIELRRIVDSEKYLMTSNIISNIIII